MTEHLIWNGSTHSYIDEIKMMKSNTVSIGIFGGASSNGAKFNEDGVFIITENEDAIFTVLFDAHTTNESVLLYTNILSARKNEIEYNLKLNTKDAIKNTENLIEEILNAPKVKEQSRQVNGETAFLVCLQKNEYLWWLSVGDNSIYVLHHEFNELGQFRLNQRIFYQWIGQKNSLDLEVPCYTKGTLQLRAGKSIVVLLTDGVLEIENRPFENHEAIKCVFDENSVESGVFRMLEVVKNSNGRDNATIIAWQVNQTVDGLRPTR